MISEDNFIRIGIIIGAHGLHGRLKVYLVSDIEERFAPGNSVFLKKDDECIEFSITEFIVHKPNIGLLKLDSIDNPERAHKFKNMDVVIKREDALRFRDKLPDDSYFYADIIGCSVYYKNEQFGTVTDIIEAGAGEILVITGHSGKDYMVPFVETMVDTSKIYEKRIEIYPVEGLFDI